MSWDRQVNRDGDTLADAAVGMAEDIGADLTTVLAYLDLIAECLVTAAFQASPDAGLRLSRLAAIRRDRGA